MSNEVRKERVRELINERFNGKKIEFATAIGKSPAQVSHWLTDQRVIGNGVASDIEKALDLPRGWLDDAAAGLPAAQGKKIRIERIDMAGACGGGAIASDWPSLISSVEFPLEAVRRLFPGRDTSGLRLVDTFGDSMEPTIPELSAIIIDTRTAHFAGDGIYFFAYAGEMYTKRLQKTPSGLVALSDNPHYQAFTIDEDDRFRIVGKYYGVISLKLAQ